MPGVSVPGSICQTNALQEQIGRSARGSGPLKTTRERRRSCRSPPGELVRALPFCSLAQSRARIGALSAGCDLASALKARLPGVPASVCLSSAALRVCTMFLAGQTVGSSSGESTTGPTHHIGRSRLQPWGRRQPRQCWRLAHRSPPQPAPLEQPRAVAQARLSVTRSLACRASGAPDRPAFSACQVSEPAAVSGALGDQASGYSAGRLAEIRAALRSVWLDLVCWIGLCCWCQPIAAPG